MLSQISHGVVLNQSKYYTLWYINIYFMMLLYGRILGSTLNVHKPLLTYDLCYIIQCGTFLLSKLTLVMLYRWFFPLWHEINPFLVYVFVLCLVYFFFILTLKQYKCSTCNMIMTETLSNKRPKSKLFSLDMIYKKP